MINARDCSVKPPIDSDIPEHPSRTLFASPATEEKPSQFTPQCIKYALGRKIHELMSQGAFSSDFENYTTIQNEHSQIVKLMSQLPPAVQLDSPDPFWDIQYPTIVKQRLQISIVCHSFLLSLHRPHVHRHHQSLGLAMGAGLKVLDVSQRLFEVTPEHQYKTFTLVFYTIDAGMLLSAMVAKYPLDTLNFREHTLSTLKHLLPDCTFSATETPRRNLERRCYSGVLRRSIATSKKTKANSQAAPAHQSLLQSETINKTLSKDLYGSQRTFLCTKHQLISANPPLRFQARSHLTHKRIWMLAGWLTISTTCSVKS